MTRSWLSATAVLLTLIIGCGGNGRSGVHGRVTLDGQPVAMGAIILTPADPTASPSAGATITDGTYDIPAERGPLPGTFAVQFKIQRPTGKRVAVGSPAPPGTMADEMADVPLPPDQNPPMSLQLAPGSNHADFTLRSGK